MKAIDIYEAYDAIISLEASGDYITACKEMRRINKCIKRRAARWQN